MPIKLKPCPFCGKKATIITYSFGNGKQRKSYDVRCEREGCILVDTGLHPTKKGAIEAWNRRADE